MIADSSSRLQRVGNLATALRDRGSCMIPVQPNHSLPIRPAPPTPTRSAVSIVTSRKTHSPIFKLLKPMNLDVVQMQTDKSSNDSSTDELNQFPPRQWDRKDNELMLTNEHINRSDYILPNMTNDMKIPKEVNSIKRKNIENQNITKYVKEVTKDMKKRKKFHEVNTSYMRDERVKNILKEYSKTCSEGEKNSQQQLVVGLWDDKKCSSSIIVSTTELETERMKEQICNKVVPPLRLKKIIREASTVEYRNVEVNSNELKNEPNYRIVTGATPRPESPYGYSTFWSSVTSEKEFETPVNDMRHKNRRSSSKSDGYKIKYRRNRLRQKLRELRSKALKLSQEMTVCNATDTSSQHNTRLRQMMNCYEKQIENISKLLCKLSASIPSTTDNVIVELDYENELDECLSTEKTTNNEAAQVNGISGSSISLSPSPEPPKLSPRSPIDYEKSKSPDAIRNSPPVLPRVYIAIDSTDLECLNQNLNVPKNWHKSDTSLSSPFEQKVKLNNTDRIIMHDNVITTSVISPVSSSFEHSGINIGKWNAERPSPKLQDSEIQQNILEDAKTFDDLEQHQQATPSISLDNFVSDSTMNIEIEGGDMRDTKEIPTAHIDQITEVSEIVTNKHIVPEKQELEQKSNEALSATSPSLIERTMKITESYKEGKLNDGNRAIARVAHETPTIIGQSQTSTANVTNILQLQSNYYNSSVARDNVVFTGIIQNSRDMQKMTPNMNQPVALDQAVPLGFTQSGSTISNSNQQCVVLPKSNSKVIQENAIQRNNGNCIMTEQFPTLGNWVARMSKKQTKSKSKLQSVTIPTTPTAEIACIPGLESQKIRMNAPNNAVRNNVVNVASQWNTERWQRQQHQRQQQLYAAASSAASPVRPGICPPISVTQFYPPNYAIDPYSSTAFGYHPAICPYSDYSYHSQLHTSASPINGYQINPLQDPHAPPFRQIQHLDKRLPTHLQDTTTRHFTTDLFKYSGSLSTGNYQHTAASLDYDRLRTATAVTQNGTASACLTPLLLSSAPLATSAQQTLVRTPLATYPTNTNQCSRNRMIPDVVAAAAAAAVVAAASFGRQRGTLPYGRTDTEIVSGGITSATDNESSQLIATNRLTNREHMPQQIQSNTIGSVIDSRRLNNGGYRQLQNLILNRLPYMKTDNTYSQSSNIFSDNSQESTIASSIPTSTYKTSPNLTSGNTSTISKELARKENRNCETPHLGKVNHTQETTNSLKCSNCGLGGSMFKCLGCEATFYCDERCQTRHWNIHVEKCPKRMPKLKKLI